MKKKIKIAIAAYLPKDVDKDKIGGPSFVALAIAQALVKDSNFEVHFISHSSSDYEVSKYNNMKIHWLPLPKKSIVPRRIRLVSSLVRELNELKPDIIHTHNSHYCLAALKTRYPVVVTAHGLRLLYHDIPLIVKSNHFIAWLINILWLNIIYLFISSPLTVGLKQRIINIYGTNIIFLMLRRAKHIITVSDYVKLKIFYLTKGNTITIDNTLQKVYYKISASPEDNKLLFAAGDVTERRKNLLLALKAFNIIKSQNPDAVLQVAGATVDEKYFDKIKMYLKNNGLEKDVVFLGQLKPQRLAEEYANCSLFLSASRYETFSLVIAQALIVGRPVVAVKSGGAMSLIDDGITGFLVENNNIKKFAEKVIFLLKNKEVRLKMARMPER